MGVLCLLTKYHLCQTHCVFIFDFICCNFLASTVWWNSYFVYRLLLNCVCVWVDRFCFLLSIWGHILRILAGSKALVPYSFMLCLLCHSIWLYRNHIEFVSKQIYITVLVIGQCRRVLKNRHCPNEWTDLRSGYQHWTGINALDRLSALASNVNEPQGASNVKVSAVAVEIAVGWWLRNCESKRNGEHCCVSNRLVYTVYCNLTVSRAKPTTTSYLYDNSVNYYRFA